MGRNAWIGLSAASFVSAVVPNAFAGAVPKEQPSRQQPYFVASTMARGEGANASSLRRTHA
jgi:hypothetical protein